MKIQINTDVHIDGTEALAARVSATLEHALKRFSEHLTRVEVHLSDENATKGGPQDHRCVLEARLQGRQPVAVTEQAATLDQAVHGAAQKLVRSLDSTLGLQQQHRVEPGKRAPEPPSTQADSGPR